jgi:hypothetical protein
MGCNGSKLDSIGCMGLSRLDDQEAVALCRGRADLLAVAARHRDALADSHAALAGSLASVSSSLHLLLLASASASAQTITLPAASGKSVDPPTPPPPPALHASSPPHSSSHIDFASSSSSGSDSGSVSSSPPHHLDARRQDQLPHHPHPHQYPHYGYPYAYAYAPDPPFGYPPPPGSLQLYYARSRPPAASVAVQQPAAPSERVYSYFGSVDQTNTRRYAYGGEPTPAAAPAPPSPPRASSWDFFNVFHGYEVHDNYCYDDAAAGTASAAAPYTPSRCSREVREEEGIPDLEEDDAVVVKEVSSEWPAPGTRSRRSSLGGVSNGIADGSEWENCVVDKGVVAGGTTAPAQPNVAAPVRKSSESADVAGEIKAQFVRAADALWALAPVLEVERRSYQYRPRRSVYHGELSAVSTTYAYSD